MYEIRFHGRGGQGGQMAAQTYALAAVREGNYAVSFPFFGAERRGAPVMAFTRVDSDQIRIKTQIYEPDYVVVLDETLLETVDVLKGLKGKGMVIINSNKKPEEVELSREVNCATVDATSIALDALGRAITNTSMLGALAKATGEVSIESIEQAIMEKFGSKLGEKIGRRNAEAARRAYDALQVGVCQGGKEFVAQEEWMPTAQELPLGGSVGTRETEAGLVGPGSFVKNKTGDWRTFIPSIDVDTCIGCRLCWFYCPEGCISMNEDNKAVIDFDYCKGCAICAEECPVDAIEMSREVKEVK